MDGLSYVCYCCKKFTKVQHTGYNDYEGEYKDLGTLSRCCGTDIFMYPDEEIEDFREEVQDLDPNELDERETALYNALLEGEEFEILNR